MGGPTGRELFIGAQPASDRDRQRAADKPWRAWYALKRWKDLRLFVFVRDLYICRRSGVLVIGQHPAPDSPVANHIKPHRGDPVLFWDPDNIETVSKAVHDSEIQKEELAMPPGVWDLAGAQAAGADPRKATGQHSGRMSRPDWFRKACIPLTVVCGPPGSGKSTYVKQHAAPADLVICFDEIATALFGRSGSVRPQAGMTPEQIADVLRQRNNLLGDIMRATARERWRSAWLILTEPEAEHRIWWHKTTGARIVVLATPADECLRRIKVDEQAGDVRGNEAQQFANGWWQRYRPAPCDMTVE